MKKLAVLLFAVVLACGTAGRANAAAIFLPGVSEAGGWLDVEQPLFSDYCWAAASSNMLKFSGWDGGFATNAAIFGNFTSHWTNQFGNPYYGINWWFDGTDDSPAGPDWSHATTPGGNYYTEALFDANYVFREDADGSTIEAQDWTEFNVDNDRAFTLLFGNASDGGLHWLTGWGYDTVDTGVWVTDSWDQVSDIFWLPLTYSAVQDRWNLNYGGADYYVISFENIQRNPGIEPNDGSGEGSGEGGGQAPEPVTLLLFAAGLAGAGYRARSRR